MTVEYSIDYKGLKLGEHQFEFELNNKFFERYPEGEIKKGNLAVFVHLNKQTTMLELDINIKGFVEVVCDRCLDEFNLPIEYGGKLIIRFGSETQEDNDELWILNENEHQVNLTQYFYESVVLSVPIARYHGMMGTQKADCKKDMLKRITDGDNRNEDIETDPRWDKLKDWRNNN